MNSLRKGIRRKKEFGYWGKGRNRPNLKEQGAMKARITGRDVRMSLRHSARHHGEGGFTLVELSIIIIIIGVALTVASLSYANANYGLKVSGAKRQIEAALNRAKTAARQQNVTYRVIFYTSANATNANSYEFMCNIRDQGGNWTMTPVDGSVSGENVSRSSGRTYVRLAEGVSLTGCSEIPGNAVMVTFRPSGTTMRISGSDLAGGNVSQTVTLNLRSGGSTGSVSINSMGEVVLR
jgi:type II secretory pathway pseudopilin PulG